MKNLYTDFQSGYINFYSYQPWIKVPLFSSSLLFLVKYFDDNHSDDVRWYFKIVSICIFMMTGDDKHVKRQLMAIQISYCETGHSVHQLTCWLAILFSWYFIFAFLYISRSYNPLNRSVLHRLNCLNAWSTAGSAVRKV